MIVKQTPRSHGSDGRVSDPNVSAVESDRGGHQISGLEEKPFIHNPSESGSSFKPVDNAVADLAEMIRSSLFQTESAYLFKLRSIDRV